MAAHKVEICQYLHKETQTQNKAHERILTWQMNHRWVKHQLSHDKRELLFWFDEDYEEFKRTWQYYYKDIY